MRLREREAILQPPGISVLVGGTPKDAAKAMLAAFGDPVRHAEIHAKAKRVASATVGAIRAKGFDVITMASKRLPNHGRLIHPSGKGGFPEEWVTQLASVFSEETND
jgi:hypothetical protein